MSKKSKQDQDLLLKLKPAFEIIPGQLNSVFNDPKEPKLEFGEFSMNGTDGDRVIFRMRVTAIHNRNLLRLERWLFWGIAEIKEITLYPLTAHSDEIFSIKIEVHFGEGVAGTSYSGDHFFDILSRVGGHNHTYAAFIYDKVCNKFKHEINEAILNQVNSHKPDKTQFCIDWHLPRFR